MGLFLGKNRFLPSPIHIGYRFEPWGNINYNEIPRATKMICKHKSESKNHLGSSLLALLSLAYLCIFYPFLPFLNSGFLDFRADSKGQIFQVIEKEDSLENDKHFLILPFSKSNILPNSSRNKKVIESICLIQPNQLSINTRSPPISA